MAKPLHVGHLRSAIIGESIKRIGNFMGHRMIGDVHLGDWGLQMGLIIVELKERKPELVYFDESYDGEYPKEAPFTVRLSWRRFIRLRAKSPRRTRRTAMRRCRRRMSCSMAGEAIRRFCPIF